MTHVPTDAENSRARQTARWGKEKLPVVELPTISHRCQHEKMQRQETMVGVWNGGKGGSQEGQLHLA